jgi:hypothetical protein
MFRMHSKLEKQKHGTVFSLFLSMIFKNYVQGNNFEMNINTWEYCSIQEIE